MPIIQILSPPLLFKFDKINLLNAGSISCFCQTFAKVNIETLFRNTSTDDLNISYGWSAWSSLLLISQSALLPVSAWPWASHVLIFSASVWMRKCLWMCMRELWFSTAELPVIPPSLSQSHAPSASLLELIMKTPGTSSSTMGVVGVHLFELYSLIINNFYTLPLSL